MGIGLSGIGLVGTLPQRAIALHVVTDEQWGFDHQQPMDVEARRSDEAPNAEGYKPVEEPEKVLTGISSAGGPLSTGLCTERTNR